MPGDNLKIQSYHLQEKHILWLKTQADNAKSKGETSSASAVLRQLINSAMKK